MKFNIGVYLWLEGMVIGAIIGHFLTRGYDFIKAYRKDWKELKELEAEYEELKKQDLRDYENSRF